MVYQSRQRGCVKKPLDFSAVERSFSALRCMIEQKICWEFHRLFLEKKSRFSKDFTNAFSKRSDLLIDLLPIITQDECGKCRHGCLFSIKHRMGSISEDQSKIISIKSLGTSKLQSGARISRFQSIVARREFMRCRTRRHRKFRL